ncbi:ras-related protein Ral-B-like [Haliotis rufescens]|uniref:ras-related protein Ral-B-like n=1 Tax=Haliotis rufescens TaxID=6454 RepID=UPI00201ED5DF|nr:ras-related protein Ral-B-like [Haliotis rufescens]
MATGFINAIRSFSMPLTGGRDRSDPQGCRLLACGPRDITQALKQTFETQIQRKSASLDTLSMNRLQGLAAGFSRITVSMSDAFILVFYMDDEECFQTISAFRERIIELKGKDVPLLVVGYNRATSAPRIMGPETADCLVTIEWGLNYKEASDGQPGDLKQVFEEMFNIVRDKKSSKTANDRRMTTF